MLLLVPSGVPFTPSKVIKHSIYNVAYDQHFIDNKVLPMAFNQTLSNVIEVVQMSANIFSDTCRSAIGLAKNNVNEWKEFDLIFTDAPPHCGAIISDLLELPRVDICPAFALRIGVGPISYIPNLLSFSSDKMNFVERVQNAFYTLLMNTILSPIDDLAYNEMKKSFDIAPDRSFQESMKMAELVIIMGHFALEYSQPVLPGKKPFHHANYVSTFSEFVKS